MILRKTCLFVALLFLTSGLSGVLIGTEGSETKELPTATEYVTTDYVVYGGEEIGLDNVTWVMQANIHVYGTLYINNSHFTWDPATDGGLEFNIHSGGALKMKYSNMTANDTTTKRTNEGIWETSWGTHWKFIFAGQGWIRDTDLSYMWGGAGIGIDDIQGGLQLLNDDITIDGVKIFNTEGTGLTLWNTGYSYTLPGAAPTVLNTEVRNASGDGIFLCGWGNSKLPYINDTKAIGNQNDGLFMFISSGVNINRFTAENNRGNGFRYRPYENLQGGSSVCNIDQSSFNRNWHNGVQGELGGTLYFTNCIFNNNNHSGVIEHDYISTYGATSFNLDDCSIKDNKRFGIETGYDWTGSEPIIDEPEFNVINSEISFNEMSGIFIGKEKLGVCSFSSNLINDNNQYGVIYDESTGSQLLTDNQIYSNGMANVYVLNGSDPSITDNTINNSALGIDLADSDPEITFNQIESNDVGIYVPAGNEPLIMNNEIEANEIGGHVFEIDGGEASMNNFTDNTDAGLVLEDCLNFDVYESNFDGNNIGIKILGGNYIDISDLTISGSTTAGIYGDMEANFSITNPTPKTNSIEVDPRTRALYFLNEGSGSLTQDGSPNNNDGVLNNNPTWIQGKWGNALNFNGVDQYVAASDSPSLDINGPELSMEAWLRIDQASLISTRTILSKEDSYKLALNTNRYVMWALNTESGDGSWVTTNVQIPIGVWVYIAVTYDNSTVKTYLDAQLKDTIPYSNGNIVDSDHLLGIGAGFNSGVGDFSDFFIGKIDEVRISDVPRSLVELQNVFNTPVAKTQIDTVSLDEASSAYVFSVQIPINQVSILDSMSEFYKFLTFSGLVLDNVTGLPLDDAYIRIYNETGEMFFQEKTNQFGSIQKVPILQYKYEGAQRTDNNPMNITVWKDGYVPLWPDTHETRDQDFEMLFEISENRAPEFPTVINNTPKETHYNKPTITWNSAKDWNMDLIKYEINVYMDELYGMEVLDDPIIKRVPHFTFERNLRYNHEYWVEVRAFDPWGLEDTVTFSFRTTNEKPTTPEVEFVETPVSSNDDISIAILNESVDMDIEPIDNVTYLVEWSKVVETGEERLLSGINAFVLSSNETSEGDEIKVVIKPFDGIEYGTPKILYIDVVNFVPENIVPIVEVEINEDETGYDLVDLNTLFTDRDNDPMFFSISMEKHVTATIDAVTGMITLIPDENWVGKDQVIVQARDTKYHDEEWPTATINVTVNSVNDAPLFILVNEKPVKTGEVILIQDIQGAPLTISCVARDADEVYGDEFTFSTNFLDIIPEDAVDEDDFQFVETTGSLSIFLSNDLVGEHLFNLTVTDDSGATSSVPIRLVVDNKNDDPKFTTTPYFKDLDPNVEIIQEIEGEVAFSINPATDPDENIPNSKEVLTYDWDFGDGTILENQGTEATHKYQETGEYSIRVTVTDKAGSSAYIEETVKINVTKGDIIPTNTRDDVDDNRVIFVIILVIIAIIVLAVVLLFIFRKDPLDDVAEEEEKKHEALVAKQQQDALNAQERLQQIMGGLGYAESAGPALPSAQPEGPEMAALPSAPSEEAQPPVEGMDQYPQPPMEQPAPEYEQPPVEQQPPMEEPAPAYPEPQMQAAPVPEQAPPEPAPAPEPAPEPEQPPMQPAPSGTVPMPEQPQAQSNLPAPEEEQQ